MPQPSRQRQDDRDRTARAQEQEFKRARGAISCAECRRLKLKCDKKVPCASCNRRGCASICPNGSLTTGQGTRFILADTDRLHRKIAEMSDRIRQLEDALAILQSSVTRETHPLLIRDLLRIKSGLELHSAINLSGHPDSENEAEEEEANDPSNLDAFGTLAVRDDGAATFYGRSAGSESLLLDEKASSPETTTPDLSSNPAFPQHIANLARAFPAAPTDVQVIDLQALIEEYLPPWPRAKQLCGLYLEQAPWFFGAVTKRQLVEETLPMFYPEASAESGSSRASSNAGSPSVSGTPGSGSTPSSVSTPLSTTTSAFSLHAASPAPSQASAHDLALLFVVFCFGALTDAALPPAPHNAEAERYYGLTKAALNLEPVLERPPGVATVQTLSLLAIYHGLLADENSIESTWALMGLSSKLAQSIGLHRDCARFKLSPAEVQKRRALFWELFITDCWQSLATGRLPTFALPFVDTELPADPDQLVADDGTTQPSFPAWKARFGQECVADVVQGTLTSRAPRYSVILELDRKIRDMALPAYAQNAKPPAGKGLNETMSFFMPGNYRELTLLYVHRTFFAKALSDHSADPLRSPYAPSFLAGYRSACALLGGLREQFALFPVQIARFWVLWTHAFSSAVMLASVVTHCGTTKTAQAAFAELRLAGELFEAAAPHGGRAVKFLPIIRRLLDKASNIYTRGLQPPRPDIFAQRTAETDVHDELDIFSGRTRTVATKAHRPAPAPRKGGQSQSSQSQSQSQSQSPPESMETIPSLESYGSKVHPALAAQMRGFAGQLDEQIRGASEYYTTHVRAQVQLNAQMLGQGQQESAGQYGKAYGGQYADGGQVGYQEPQPQQQKQNLQELGQHYAPHGQYVQPVQYEQPAQYDQLQQAGWYAQAHDADVMPPPLAASSHHQHQPAYHHDLAYAQEIAESGSRPATGHAHAYTAPPSVQVQVHMDQQQTYPHQTQVQAQLWSVAHSPDQLVYPESSLSPTTPVYTSTQFGVHVQDEMMPPPPPQQQTTFVNTTAYSLQESWQTWMQQELPLPPAQAHPHSHSHGGHGGYGAR